MRKISLFLAVLMVMISLVACKVEVNVTDDDTVKPGETNNDAPAKDDPAKDDPADEGEPIAVKDAVLADMVAAIEKKAPFADKVSEPLYKDADPDEMVCWIYGVIDINAYELLSDYVITMPSDYSNTIAILKFEDGMTADDFAEVKAVITDEYIDSRRSALQMYMPEEYQKVEWALSNPDKIWRQYGDNMLVLAIYDAEEPTAVWEAIDAYFGK